MPPIVAHFFGIFDDNWPLQLRPDTPFKQCTRIYIAFGKIVPATNNHLTIAIDGNIYKVYDLIYQARNANPQLEIFLSVGGDDSSDSFGGACQDEEFAANALTFLQRLGCHGLDIDWETDINKDHLSLLTKNLQAAFRPSGRQLTLDGWPGASEDCYDFTVLKETLSQINIMSYGSAMDLKFAVESYRAAGFPVNQLIGGIETEIDYIDPDTLGPEGTIAAKCRYARENGLAGMMSWRLDNDYAAKIDVLSSQGQNNLYTELTKYPTYQGAMQLWSSMKNP